MPISATTAPYYSFSRGHSITGVSITLPRSTQATYSPYQSLLTRRLLSATSGRTRHQQTANRARMNAPDIAIPTAAKQWNKKTLIALGVRFERDSHSIPEFAGTMDQGIQTMLTLPEGLQTGCSPSSTRLRVVVDTISAELALVNNGNVITPDFEFVPNEEVPGMFRFESAFGQLSNILSRNESISSTPQNRSPFTTPPTQFTLPQSTSFPGNPQHSSPSSASSKSNESGREPSSSLFAMNFLQATFQSIQNELKNAQWYLASGYRIKPEYLPHKMKVKLGNTAVTAISDGGLSLFPKSTASKNLPILCIEAKRQKYAQLDRESTEYAHAGQIYAQMLGMLCHRELYTRPSDQSDDYQEAFILHLRHATFYIFYARFPVSYLKFVSDHGRHPLFSGNLADEIPEAKKIKLKRSRRFRMRKPEHQAAFFRALARILYYLVSGHSKVGYMSMEDWNPYFQRLHGLHKPVMYECIPVRVKQPENASDSDSEAEELNYIPQNRRESVSSSTGAEYGSPMSE